LCLKSQPGNPCPQLSFLDPKTVGPPEVVEVPMPAGWCPLGEKMTGPGVGQVGLESTEGLTTKPGEGSGLGWWPRDMLPLSVSCRAAGYLQRSWCGGQASGLASQGPAPWVPRPFSCFLFSSPQPLLLCHMCSHHWEPAGELKWMCDFSCRAPPAQPLSCPHPHPPATALQDRSPRLLYTP
jgi:hypothetical protein